MHLIEEKINPIKLSHAFETQNFHAVFFFFFLQHWSYDFDFVASRAPYFSGNHIGA